MTVADPAAFVAAAATNEPIIEAGLATQLNVDASDVDATISLPSNRPLLSISAVRRLQAGSVQVDAVVTVADAAAATDMQTTVDGTTAADFTTALTTEFTNAGQTDLGIEVTTVTSVVVSTGATTTVRPVVTASHAKPSSSVGSVAAAV